MPWSGRFDALTDALRRAAPSVPVPEAAASFVDKVQHHAYRVTDDDVRALREAGLDEDRVFELTVQTAVFAGLARLDAGRRALQGEE